MNFPEAIKSGFNHYVTFSGRATRSQYWYWVLFVWAVEMVLHLVTGSFSGVSHTTSGGFNAAVDTTNTSPLPPLFLCAVLLPSIAVSVRRLHDTGKSGWWLLLSFIPLIGQIILIVWYCTKSDFGPNRYGI